MKQIEECGSLKAFVINDSQGRPHHVVVRDAYKEGYMIDLDAHTYKSKELYYS